jgi:hypothetical protein
MGKAIEEKMRYTRRDLLPGGSRTPEGAVLVAVVGDIFLGGWPTDDEAGFSQALSDELEHVGAGDTDYAGYTIKQVA